MHSFNPATNEYLLHSPFVCDVVLETVRVQRGAIFRLVSQELIIKETCKVRKQNKAINTQYFKLLTQSYKQVQSKEEMN